MYFNKFRPISISLSPNVQKDDVVLAWKLLWQPHKWNKGEGIKKLENTFKTYQGAKYALSFNSGRSALYAILKALNLPQGSQVAMQAFTCNAVANPILWAGFEPLYVDCGNDFTMDVEDLKKKITPQTKAVILQHTFGLPARIQEVLNIAKEKGIFVIEDCAHALGATYQDKLVGTFGDAAFFSFSRDKVISSVYGGVATTDNDVLGGTLEKLQQEFGLPNPSWTRQQIMHPVLLSWIILPIYNFIDLGKLFLIFSQYAGILSKAVSWQEKQGAKPDYFPKALPNALATMALHQLGKLDTLNKQRKELAGFYYQKLQELGFGLPEKGEHLFLRFAITHPKAHEILYEAWHQQNMLLGDWYRSPVDPHDTDPSKLKYTKGSCPNAERLSKITLNLPTHINISMKEAQRIVDFLIQWK